MIRADFKFQPFGVDVMLSLGSAKDLDVTYKAPEGTFATVMKGFVSAYYFESDKGDGVYGIAFKKLDVSNAAIARESLRLIQWIYADNGAEWDLDNDAHQLAAIEWVFNECETFIGLIKEKSKMN